MATVKQLVLVAAFVIIRIKSFFLLIFHGTYSLVSNSEEEEIARDYICFGNPTVTVVVVDATNLERCLNLVFQIKEITSNIIVCVNLLDEAKKKGIKIDLNKLAKELNVPVIGTIAKKRKTLDILLEHIIKASDRKENLNTSEDFINTLMNNQVSDDFVIDIINKSAKVCNQVCKYEKSNYKNFERKIDKFLTSKITGIPIMLAFLGIIFWLTIIGSNYPSKILFSFFEIIQSKLLTFFDFINSPEWLKNMLVLGIFQTVTWIISVMLPPMAIFFPLFTFLEDLGFLPRLAFNMDGFFSKALTNGKQMITMCMGFGCNAAGVVGTRIMETSRERIIAAITNAFVPCNGRYPFLIAIASIFIASSFYGFQASIISTFAVILTILLGIILTLLISRLLSKTLLKGGSSSFILELPPYRKPDLRKNYNSIYSRQNIIHFTKSNPSCYTCRICNLAFCKY